MKVTSVSRKEPTSNIQLTQSCYSESSIIKPPVVIDTQNSQTHVGEVLYLK